MKKKFHNIVLFLQPNSKKFTPSLPILLCRITTQISVVIGGVLVAIGIPTATTTITRTGSNLLPTRGQIIGSRTGAT
jgi:hypothetical protein